jgi:ribosomal protein L18E
VVGGGDALTAKGLTVKAHAFTASARAAIEGNGGTCVVLPKTAPAEAAPAAAE